MSRANGVSLVLNFKPEVSGVSKFFRNNTKVNGVGPAADFWYPSMRQPAPPH
jgi:hypothetical protein